MEKILILHILAILLPYCLSAMNMQRMLRTPSRFEFQKRSYSTNSSSKSLATLSFPEVQKLAYNKEFAHKELKSALFRYEDIKAFPISTKKSSDEVAWKNILNQFSIKDWNSMLLEREENTILKDIHPILPNYIKTINFEKKLTHQQNPLKINNFEDEAKEFYNAQPLDESLQKYYQKNLEIAGYLKIPTIYHWNNNSYGCACSIYPHAFVTKDFINLPLDRCLGILAHEDQHVKNFHVYKEKKIRSFLDEQKTPNIYSQFTEKEADLKASAHGLTIARGLLHFFQKSKKYRFLNYRCPVNYSSTHPSLDERINYIQELIGKLEQEQKGYSWNPFYKMLGLTEWIKKLI